MNKVSTELAPAAIGPYSQAITTGDLVFTSGQVPLDSETGEVVGTTIEEQADRVFKNLKAVLEEAGSGLGLAVKTTCFLADMNDFAAFNGVYEKYFSEMPARSCVEVSKLPKGVLCEVEVIAEIDRTLKKPTYSFRIQ